MESVVVLLCPKDTENKWATQAFIGPGSMVRSKIACVKRPIPPIGNRAKIVE